MPRHARPKPGIKKVGKRVARIYAPRPDEFERWSRDAGASYRWSGTLSGYRGPPRKLYLHHIKPEDFLVLAEWGRDIKRDKRHWIRHYGKEKGIIVQDKGIDPLTLWIRPDNCQAISHEGRHRASIAYKSGIDYMPIILVCEDEDWKQCLHCYSDFPNKLIAQFDSVPLGKRSSRR